MRDKRFMREFVFPEFSLSEGWWERSEETHDLLNEGGAGVGTGCEEGFVGCW
jgi:hypothetical protein